VKLPTRVAGRLPSKAIIGFAVMAAVVVCALLAPWLAPYDPNDQSLPDRLSKPNWLVDEDNGYFLGSDGLGRDILSRIIYGSRISLTIGILAVGLSGILGSLLGMSAGYFGGWWEQLVLRLADIILSIPFILLAIAIVAVLGPSIVNLVIVFVATRWVRYARVAAAQTLSVKEGDFVAAANAMGASPIRTMRLHVLPNITSALIVLATLDFGFVIIIESGLSFLGLGVPPQIPSWGGMLADGRNILNLAWWISTFPGLAIVATVTAFNLLGDWLRDKLDPTLRGQG